MDREGSIQQLIPQSFHDNTQFFIGRLTTKMILSPSCQEKHRQNCSFKDC